MPAAIPRACRKRGCALTTTDRTGYCPNHINEGWAQYQRGLTRQARGYGSAWATLRQQILERDKYLCAECLRNGRAVTARTVDHIRAKAHGGTDAPGNLQSLCWPCHHTKTGRERFRK